MSRTRSILLTAGLALIAHLLLGWMAVIPVAALGGFLAEKTGVLTGLYGVLGAWSMLVVYSFVVAPGPTQEMNRVMGELAGGLPPMAITAITLVAGALLGATSGWMGSALRNILR